VVLTPASGTPPQAGSCTKLEVPVGDDEEERVCVEYSCPFISFPAYANTTNIAATPPFNMTANPTKDHPFYPLSIPELLVTYNFSSPSGLLRNEVYLNFKMSKSVKGLQKIRLTRGSHDVVSYMIDVWDEMKPEVMFSFRGLLKDVSLPHLFVCLLIALRRLKGGAQRTFGRSADLMMRLGIYLGHVGTEPAGFQRRRPGRNSLNWWYLDFAEGHISRNMWPWLVERPAWYDLNIVHYR